MAGEPEYRYYRSGGLYFRLRLANLSVARLAKDGSWQPDPTEDAWNVTVDGHLLSDQQVNALGLAGTP